MNYLLLIILPAIFNLIIMRYSFLYLQKIRGYDIGYFRNNHTWLSKSGFIHRYNRDHVWRIKMTRKRLIKIALMYIVPGLSLFLMGLTCLAFILDVLLKIKKEITDYLYVKAYRKKLENKNKNKKKEKTNLNKWLSKELSF